MLVSGESYTIKEIFKENLKIVIPDMQREYCWAHTISENYKKPLVETFINDVFDLVKTETEIQMGLLYGYESPKNEIQICDGQQRITTLYLTIGVLLRNITDDELKNEIKEILISDYELNRDDKEPRLQYAIRESTLFFLRDLVFFYFLQNDNNCKEDGSECIKKQYWYFNEYNLDPSIQNMLTSIDLIENILSNKNNEKELDYNLLAKNIIKKIKFLFFNMGNRIYGEEQFVVLNTTGKPLSITENLKPRILSNLDDSKQLIEKNNKTELQYYADLWEEWEHFFWLNKPNEHLTADDGLNEFLRWIYIIEMTNVDDIYYNDEKYNDSQIALSGKAYDFLDLVKIKGGNKELLDTINEYYENIKSTLIHDKEIKDNFLFKKKPLSQIDCFKFLPILLYVHFFGPDIKDRKYLRVKQFFQSRSKDRNLSRASIVTVLEAIKIIKLMEADEICDLAKIIRYSSTVSTMVLNQTEIFKFNLLLKNSKDRDVYEDAFWEAENLESCNGNIQFLFEALEIDINAQEYFFDVTAFNKMKKIVSNTFEKNSDLIRRTLLTFGDYYLWHGNTTSLEATRYSFVNSPKFYGDIGNSNDKEKKNAKETIINFLKALMNLENIDTTSLDKYFNNCCEQYEENESSLWEKARYEFVKRNDLWSFMGNKMFCISYDKSKIYVLSQEKVTGNNTYSLLLSNEVFEK
ncbi:MAG: DUF262 domain-containing protein [Bacteroidales bacterium]|jgi:hypothetical protein